MGSRSRNVAVAAGVALLLAASAYLALRPTTAERLEQRLAERRWQDAEALARDALEGAPGDERADLLRALGIAHGRQGEHADALEAYTAAFELRPEVDDLRHRMAIEIVGIGRDHEARGETEAALARYREAVATASEIPHGHRALVAALRTQGRTGETIEALRAALRAGPRDVHHRLALAWLLATHPDPAQRDPEAAIELAEEVLLHDRTPETLDTYAVALAALGDYTRAVRFELDAIELAGGRDGPDFEARRERLRAFMNEQPYTEPQPSP